ncbi:mechanosensitive ion channel family protein [Haloferax namakaokahaiae]|uniref:Mechanosensitive ion channel family protein n=1 Tax=Haloferax namakaokahaiae TaxID=1748331 RepID=A0ABD5ZAA7_9EURY
MRRDDDVAHSLAHADYSAGGAAASPFFLQSEIAGVTLPEWVSSPGVDLLLAVFVMLASVVVSKYAVRLLGRPVARRFRRQSVAQTVLRFVRLTIVMAGAAVAANILHLEVGQIVLSVTVFSAVLGIILAPIVGSIINGVFVLADQPYEIGDMIELDNGRKGFVEEITLRYTKMFTLDNTFLVMPNASIRERDVINYSAEDERTRLTLDVLVTYESDIQAARDLIERAARDSDQVIEGGPDIRIGSARYPAKPTAYIDNFADNGILIRLRFWGEKPYKIGTIRSNVQTRLLELLETSDANVEFAYPHTHVMFDETSGELHVGETNGETSSPVAPPPGLSNTRDSGTTQRTEGRGTATGDGESKDGAGDADDPKTE